MTVNVRPAPHPRGTSLEVRDLFYNTPARRKFLRTEKTEFGHLEEVVKRQALSRPDVAFSLTHNGRVVHGLAPAIDTATRERRVASVVGPAFMEQAVPIERVAGDLSLRGWVGLPTFSRSQADLQYFFVNGRVNPRQANRSCYQAGVSRCAVSWAPSRLCAFSGARTFSGRCERAPNQA